ncbi:MAG: type IV pilus biogenesis/stability protein PilW [Legionella sp.]|nr:MAG: type IV pilus biogenesis/stability protein PilW [Legionella sp.]
MTNGLLKVLPLACVLLQGCQHTEAKQEPENSKVDLKKAASFNVQLGLGYLKQGDRPRAKKKLLTALEQAPNSPDVSAALGYYFEQTSELEQAKKYYGKALDLSGNSGAQLNNYGTFLCRQGDYKKAEQYFLKAVKDPQYVHTSGAFENAGLCALQVPDEAKAKIYFTSAINQDPSRRESLYELVKLESKMGQNKEALELLQNHSDLVLDDKILLNLAKDIANQTGKTELALEYANNARKLEPSIDNSGVNNDNNSHNG